MTGRRNILAFLLTASVLLVGIVSSTHHHLYPAASDVGLLDSVAAHQHDACGHFHCDPLTSGSPQHSDSAPCDHDHDDDCQICRLLVDFCATPTLSFQLVLDSIVEPARQPDPASVVASTTLRVRSRAPPIV